MNYELIINDLKAWTKEESFYRDFFCTKRMGGSVTFLIEDPAISSEYKGYVLHPETIDPNKTEEDFFNTGRNVSIIKHPRYFPYFEHQHAFFEIIYVLSGQCKEITSDRTVILSEGELCLLAPNITHGIEVFDDSVVLNILIRQSTFMDIFWNTIRDKSQIALFFLGHFYEKSKIRYLLYHTAGDTVIRNYILDMYAEQILPDDYSDRIICSLLTIFFTQLTRRHGLTVESAVNSAERSEYSADMLNYIMNHYADTSLNDLAEQIHFSVPYCSRLIKEVTGISFSDLLTGVRLHQGENLLSHTQMSIADISEKLGYKNPETFIRAFQRTYQLSPSQYRKSTVASD